MMMSCQTNEPSKHLARGSAKSSYQCQPWRIKETYLCLYVRVSLTGFNLVGSIGQLQVKRRVVYVLRSFYYHYGAVLYNQCSTTRRKV